MPEDERVGDLVAEDAIKRPLALRERATGRWSLIRKRPQLVVAPVLLVGAAFAVRWFTTMTPSGFGQIAGGIGSLAMALGLGFAGWWGWYEFRVRRDDRSDDQERVKEDREREKEEREEGRRAHIAARLESEVRPEGGKVWIHFVLRCKNVGTKPTVMDFGDVPLRVRLVNFVGGSVADATTSPSHVWVARAPQGEMRLPLQDVSAAEKPTNFTYSRALHLQPGVEQHMEFLLPVGVPGVYLASLRYHQRDADWEEIESALEEVYPPGTEGGENAGVESTYVIVPESLFEAEADG